MPKPVPPVTKFCSYCGTEFTRVPRRKSESGRETCSVECEKSLRNHRRYGDSPARKRTLILQTAERVARYDKTVYCSEVAKALGWHVQAVRRFVRELTAQGRWPYHAATSAPRRDVLWNCDWCGNEFRDPQPWIDRSNHFCSRECADRAFVDARLLRNEILTKKARNQKSKPAVTGP